MPLVGGRHRKVEQRERRRRLGEVEIVERRADLERRSEIRSEIRSSRRAVIAPTFAVAR